MMKQKILCITNSFPIHPRLKKIASLFEEYSDLYFFSWDRENSFQSLECKEENVFVYSSHNGYGTAFKMLLGVPKFIHAVRKELKNVNPDILIIRHWSTCFVLLPLIPKKYKVIYDVSDMPDSENKNMVKVYKLLERYVLKHSDVVILSSSYYLPFYENRHKSIYVLENKVDTNLMVRNKKDYKHERLTISFIGMIRYYETLINLIEASKELPIDIHLYGKGIDSKIISHYCLTEKINNVFIHGAYDYKDIERLYRSSDLIYTAYPSMNENVQYSIPNKLYEALLFERPLIASVNTALGNIVEKENLGFVVDSSSVESINSVLKQVLNNPLLIENARHSMASYKKNNDVYWNSYKENAKKIIDKLI